MNEGIARTSRQLDRCGAGGRCRASAAAGPGAGIGAGERRNGIAARQSVLHRDCAAGCSGWRGIAHRHIPLAGLALRETSIGTLRNAQKRGRVQRAAYVRSVLAGARRSVGVRSRRIAEAGRTSVRSCTTGEGDVGVESRYAAIDKESAAFALAVISVAISAATRCAVVAKNDRQEIEAAGVGEDRATKSRSPTAEAVRGAAAEAAITTGECETASAAAPETTFELPTVGEAPPPPPKPCRYRFRRHHRRRLPALPPRSPTAYAAAVPHTNCQRTILMLSPPRPPPPPKLSCPSFITRPPDPP